MIAMLVFFGVLLIVHLKVLHLGSKRKDEALLIIGFMGSILWALCMLLYVVAYLE